MMNVWQSVAIGGFVGLFFGLSIFLILLIKYGQASVGFGTLFCLACFGAGIAAASHFLWHLGGVG